MPGHGREDWLTIGNQEQIAASHEIDGVRKEKERLTAASLNKRFLVSSEKQRMKL